MAEILTIDEAAERLKLKSDTVRDWCHKGKLRASKLGRIWRIDAAALEELMRGTTSEALAVPTPAAVETPRRARQPCSPAASDEGRGLEHPGDGHRLNAGGRADARPVEVPGRRARSPTCWPRRRAHDDRERLAYAQAMGEQLFTHVA